MLLIFNELMFYSYLVLEILFILNRGISLRKILSVFKTLRIGLEISSRKFYKYLGLTD